MRSGNGVSGASSGWAHCWVLRERALCVPRIVGGCLSLLWWGGCLWVWGVGVCFFVRAGLLPYRPGSLMPVGLPFWGGFAGWGFGVLVVGWAGCWLLFVNCIVDASIFVAKLFRAHGGCLGTRGR